MYHIGSWEWGAQQAILNCLQIPRSSRYIYLFIILAKEKSKLAMLSNYNPDPEIKNRTISFNTDQAVLCICIPAYHDPSLDTSRILLTFIHPKSP